MVSRATTVPVQCFIPVPADKYTRTISSCMVLCTMTSRVEEMTLLCPFALDEEVLNKHNIWMVDGDLLMPWDSFLAVYM